MGSNPFDVLDQPAVTAKPPVSSGGNPFDVVSNTSPASTSQPATTMSATNPFDILGGTPQTQDTAAPNDEGFGDKVKDIWNSDENALGKTWDTINTPLVNLKRDKAHGVEAGAEEFATGLTTPLSVGLTLATFGVGGILERLGLNVAEMAAPEVISAAKAMGKLVSAGFTEQMIGNVAEKMPDLNKAIQDHDWDKVGELGTNLALNAGMAGIGAKHVIKDLGVFGGEGVGEGGANGTILKMYRSGMNRINFDAAKIAENGKKAVPNQLDQEALHWYGEAGGDQDTLADWRQRLVNSKTMAPDLQRQVIQDIDRAMTLPPEISRHATDLAPGDPLQSNNLRTMYDTVHDKATATDEDGNPTDTHIMDGSAYRPKFFARAPWDMESDEVKNYEKASDKLGESGPDHTQKRVYEYTIDGLEQGMKPRKVGGRYMFNAYDLGADYYRAMETQMLKKQLVEFAKTAYDADGRPLAVPGGIISKFDKTMPATEQGGEREATGDTVTMGDASRVGSHALNKAEIKRLTESGQLHQMILDGRIKDRGKGTLTTTAPDENPLPGADSAQATPPSTNDRLNKIHQAYVDSGNEDLADVYMQGGREHGMSYDKIAEKMENEAAANGVGDSAEDQQSKALYSKQAVAPTWYLKSDKVIQDKMRGPMPADQVAKMLEGAGVKEDELHWTGLSDLLESKGKEKVTPQELRDHIAASNVEPQEITKGLQKLEPLTSEEDGELLDLELIPEEERTQEQRVRARELLARYDDTDEYGESLNGTKFSSYVLPGGENYREMLLTKPTGQEAFDPSKVTYKVTHPDTNGGDVPAADIYYDGKLLRSDIDDFEAGPDEKEQLTDIAQQIYQHHNTPEGVFTESHWDEPNVIAHVRYNDRTGPNGEKLLHLEEVQSDWHQKGRDQGYQSESPDSSIPDAPFKKTWHEMVLRRMLRHAADSGYDGVSWTPGAEQNARYFLANHVDNISWRRNEDGTYDYYGTKEGEHKASQNSVTAQELARHLGKDAANRIVEASKPTDAKTLGYTAKLEKYGYDIFDPSGKRVASEVDAKSSDAALDKQNKWLDIDKRHGNLSGEGLEVGGSGMKGFYDKIVPDYLNKVGKRYGAKVGETEINNKVSVKGSEDFWKEVVRVYRHNIGQPLYADFSKDGELRDFSVDPVEVEGPLVQVTDAAGNLLKDANIPKYESGKKVQFLPITDEMRDSLIQEGQPLFGRANEQGDRIQAKTPAGELTTNEQGDNILHLNKGMRDLLADVHRRDKDSIKDFDGVSISKNRAPKLLSILGKMQDEMKGQAMEEHVSSLKDLLKQAYDKAGKEGVIVVGKDIGDYEGTAREELNHGDQRRLTPSGDIEDHLDPAAFKRLRQAIPLQAHAYFDKLDYPIGAHGSTRVVELAAKLMAGLRDKIGLSPAEEEEYLKQYFDEVVAKHGESALEEFKHTVGKAKELRDERIANATDEFGVPNRRTDDSSVRGIQEGRQAGDKGSPGSLASKPETTGEDKPGEVEPGQYRFNTDDYDSTIRNRYSWKNQFMGKTGDGQEFQQRAPLAYHPSIARTMQLILDPKKSWVEKSPTLSSIMKISTAAKKSLLSLSGFHWGQIGLRAVESGVNPLKPALEMSKGVGGIDFNNPVHVKLIESGLQTGYAQGSSMFNEGLRSGPLGNIPIIGKALDNVNEALFGPNGFIDRNKLQAAIDFERRLKGTNPELSEDDRFKVASQLANYRFGGLDYLAMGRSRDLQDTLRLLMLAPDWLESSGRDALASVGPYGRLGRFDLARIAAYNFVAAQSLNMLTTGKIHPETPFGVVSKDGKKVYSVRTMPQDIYHLLTQPMDFVSNRLNPVLSRTAVEAITGRDKEGRIREAGDQLKDLIANITPIPLQGATNAITGNYHPGVQAGDYVRSAAGLTTKPNNSPAESVAYRLASENSKSANLPSEAASHFHRVMELEDRMRDGDTSAIPELTEGLNSGKLSIDDYKQITSGATKTRLQADVNRLPMEQAMQVWHYATNQERETLMPTMAQKMMSYRKTESFKLTPQQQAKMDVKLAQLTSEMLPDETTK